jgi:TonB family protein
MGSARRRARALARPWAPVLAVALTVVVVAVAGAAPEDRLTRREREDPLEPWSLEPGREEAPSPGPVPADTSTVPEAAEASREAEQAEGPIAAEDGERVPVVRCRQVLVSHPAQAERLAALLRSGANLDEVRRAAAGVEIEEHTREYALEELQDDVRSEVEALPAGGWSRVRPWHGRAALFQVVEKAERARSELPQLGAGLDASERDRVAEAGRASAARRASAPPPAAAAATGAERGVEKAAVVNQVSPEFPPTASGGGEVTVLVEIDRLGQPIDVRVVSSSDRIFEIAAMDAARRSTYRGAKRDGIPEPGTVTLTFRFVAPTAQPGEPPTGTPHD